MPKPKIIALFFSALIIIGALAASFLGKPLAPPDKNSIMMKITSSAFSDGGNIPAKFTCDGQNISPSLHIAGVPVGAKSLALVIDDPDAPSGNWTHCLAWNIGPDTQEIREGSMPSGAVSGLNDFGRTSYGGPCPPIGAHRYQFKIYALGKPLSLDSSADKGDLEEAMTGHILDQAVLVGIYRR